MTDKKREELLSVFDSQVKRLIDMKYFKLAKLTEEKFIEILMPLREKLDNITVGDENIPFVIVVKSSIVTPEKAMALVKAKGQQGEVRMTPLIPKDFAPLDSLKIPESEAYLLIGVDTGQKTLNVTPHNALEIFYKEKRSPLTIDEGVALVLQFPEVLTDKKKYNSFSILGSRRNDQRVPAMWISFKKPRLGWCWDNNPHTWLGSASCQTRIGV